MSHDCGATFGEFSLFEQMYLLNEGILPLVLFFGKYLLNLIEVFRGLLSLQDSQLVDLWIVDLWVGDTFEYESSLRKRIFFYLISSKRTEIPI